jgi:hypothetical protein
MRFFGDLQELRELRDCVGNIRTRKDRQMIERSNEFLIELERCAFIERSCIQER